MLQTEKDIFYAQKIYQGEFKIEMNEEDNDFIEEDLKNRYWDDYLKEHGEGVIEELKKRNYLKEQVETNKAGILVIILISIAIIAFISFLSWQIYDQKFKSSVEISSNNTCNPIINAPDCPPCSLSCPSLTCPDFPSKLKIEIQNST